MIKRVKYDKTRVQYNKTCVQYDKNMCTVR
jgi:hypothetical protein